MATPDAPATQNTTRPTVTTDLLGHGSGWWSVAMLWALGIAALAAVLVVIATAAVVEVQKREADAANAELARYKIEAGGKISSANDRATAAELETQQLKAKFSWRTISTEQRAQLLQVLAAHPGAVNIQFQTGDPEGQ